MSWLVAYFLAAIVLDHAHLVSPIGLAWSSTPMRRKMLVEWDRYILLPLCCLAAATVAGLAVSSTGDPLFQLLAKIYFWWNAWHFGSQHFGVASLLGWRSGPRWVRQALTIGPTMAIWVLPFFVNVFSLAILIMGMSLLHWTTDIGLSTWKAGKWLPFLCIVIVLGGIGFVFKTVTIDSDSCALGACKVAYGIPLLLAVRYGLGFVHFLYSRWVWQSANMRLMALAT